MDKILMANTCNDILIDIAETIGEPYVEKLRKELLVMLDKRMINYLIPISMANKMNSDIVLIIDKLLKTLR